MPAPCPPELGGALPAAHGEAILPRSCTVMPPPSSRAGTIRVKWDPRSRTGSLLYMRGPFPIKFSCSCYWALGRGVKRTRLERNFLQGPETGFSPRYSRGWRGRQSPRSGAAEPGWGGGVGIGLRDPDGAAGSGRRLRSPRRSALRREAGARAPRSGAPPTGACSVNHGGNFSLTS